MFQKLGENLVVKALASKVAEINPDKVLAEILKQFHDAAENLKKDADGDGLSELENIQADLAIVGDKLADVAERLEKAGVLK